jgi:hypothetical protein
LLRPAGDETKLIPVFALHDNVSFLVRNELADFEVTDDILVLAKLGGDVAKVFNSHVFASAYENDVGFAAK